MSEGASTAGGQRGENEPRLGAISVNSVGFVASVEAAAARPFLAGVAVGAF